MIDETLTSIETLEAKLRELAQQGKLPHAMLFTSPEGGGAMPLAMKLAQFIMCPTRTTAGPCNECNSCNSVKNLIHPDVFLSFPVFNKDGKRKYTCKDFIGAFSQYITTNPYGTATDWIQSQTSENKQGNISAEECNEISGKLALRPILGGAKILIIWYAEYLGKEGNKLLKLIEEPPKNTYIMLVAENTNKILGTILSRTQLFKLPPISNAEVEKILSDKGVDAELAIKLAKQSEGNIFKALQLKEHSGTDYFSHFRNWMNALYTNNGALLASWLKESNALSKEELKSFFGYANHIFEQGLRVQHLPAKFWSLTEPEERLVKGLISKGLKTHHCEAATACCTQAIYHTERNVYKKVMLNAISFEVQEALLKP